MSDVRFINEEQVLGVSLCPPAVRIVVVAAWAFRSGADDGPFYSEHRVHPVVAVRSTVARHYTRRLPVPKSSTTLTSPVHSDMLRMGWSFEYQSQRLDSIIVVEDGGMMSARDAFDDSDAEWEEVCCPWPAEEDCSRLVGAIDRLKDIAALRAELQTEASETRA